MPLELPGRTTGTLADDAPGGRARIGEPPAIPMPIDPERPIPISARLAHGLGPPRPEVPAPAAAPNAIQTARQFLEARAGRGRARGRWSSPPTPT